MSRGMSQSIMRTLRTNGRLPEMMRRAAQEGLEPMLGAAAIILGEAPVPWERPPAVVALVSLTEAAADGFRGVVWLGGDLDDLGTVAAALLGERPDGDDESLQDCVRELTNVLAGRIQEQLREVGPATGLGLPLYLSGAHTLVIGGGPAGGVALRVRLDVPDQPEILVGFVAGDS